jgi:hypothetical protein
MDAIPEHTRSFSDLVTRIYAVIKWENMDQAHLQLVAKFFDVDKGAVVKIHDDKDDFESVASLWIDDREIRQQVNSWRSKLPSFSTDGELAGNHGYLLKRIPSKPAHNVSGLFQRITDSRKETSLLSVISKRQRTHCLIWLYRNADKPDFMPYDLEFLKMVMLHLRQAIDFRQQIDNLKKHLSGKGYVA